MTPQKITDTLRSKGICPTQQRVAVYECLLNHRTHPTADTLYHALVKEHPSFSRTTVYNTVHVLAKAGLIRVVTIDAGEQHFDAFVEQHGHFRCACCEKLFDFSLSADMASNLTSDGFLIETSDVYATGLCPTCQNKSLKTNI